MYIEYFNIMNSDAPGTSLFVSISFLIIVSLLIFIKIRVSNPKLSKILPLFTFIGIIALIISSFFTGVDYRSLKKIVIKNKHLTVEGIVEDFNPLNETELLPESFNVNGVEFSYFDDKGSSAFHESSLSGGPIKEGLPVRIFYYDNKILGLWIKEN